MSQENVEVVQRHIEAWNRGDRAAFLATFRSDAEIDWSRALKRCTKASIAVVAGRRPSGTSSGRRSRRASLRCMTSRGRGPKSVLWNTAHMRGRDGIEVTARSALVYTVENGEITRLRLFQGRAEALEAVGLQE